jgi:GNAT superfamily N-acetyltransferase
MEIRCGTDMDLPAEYKIFCVAQGKVARSAGINWQAPPYESWRQSHSFILNTPGGSNLVMLRDGTIVGYCSTIQKGTFWFLSALFISPEAQGAGVGSALLKASWPASHVIRATISESFQLKSTGLYSRLGMTSVVPLMSLGGQPREMADVLSLEPLPGGDIADITSLAYGFDRTDEYLFWKATSQQTLWSRDGVPAAVSFANAQMTIGPLMARTHGDAEAAFRSQLKAVGEMSCSCLIPASSRNLLDIALAAGLQYTRPPGLLLSSQKLALSEDLILSGYWLM